MQLSPFVYTEPFSLKRPRDAAGCVCHGFGVEEPKHRLEEEDETINRRKKITNDNPNRGDTGRKNQTSKQPGRAQKWQNKAKLWDGLGV